MPQIKKFTGLSLHSTVSGISSHCLKTTKINLLYITNRPNLN